MEFEILSDCKLFEGFSENEIEYLIEKMDGRKKHFDKGSYIYTLGEKIHSMGLVLKGSVMIEKIDYWGNRNIIAKNDVGDVFAEVYACCPEEPLMVNVISDSDSEILFLNIKKLMNGSDVISVKMTNRIIKLIARKNLVLSRKINDISPKSIRERLMSYFSYCTEINKSNKFCIDFNRQEFADYLCVDRSSLSNELSKMKKDGLIDFNKNFFVILK